MKAKKKEDNKIKKILKWVAIICGIIIVLELLYLIFVYVSRESKNAYYDGLNAIDIIDNGYIVVGSSDFKHSKGNTWTKGIEKAKLAKYDENKKLVWETKYKKGYNTTFYDIEEISDGYIAVGSGEFSKEQNKNKLRDAFIVKYDKDGNIIFDKKFQILGNSKFTKVRQVEDGIIVVGQSIFPPMDLGFDDRGGGVIVKYDFDGNEIFRANYGGSKSGLFNDFVITDDGLYLVGKDAANTGILVKYNFNGERQWVKNYSYTDSLGFSSIIEYNNELIIAGAKKVKDDDSNYDTDALLVKYDKAGKLLMEKTYTSLEAKEEDGKVIDTTVSMDRFNTLTIDKDKNIVLAGQTTIKDTKESTKEKNVFRYSGLFAKYTIDGKKLAIKEIGGSRDDYFTGIMLEGKNYLITGYSNSSDKDFKHTWRNGRSFKPAFISLDKDGKIIKIK